VWAAVREPKRGATDAPVIASGPHFIAEEPASLGATLRMFATRPALTLVSLSAAATQFVNYGTLGFTTLFLMREKGMTLNEIALWYALVLGAGVSAGIFLPGILIDRLAGRFPQVFGLLPGIALALAMPFFVGFVQAPTWPVALAFLAVPTFLNYFYLTPTVTLVQNSVSAKQRTLAGAVLLLIMNLLGLGLGPTWVGAWSDWLRPTHPEHSLQLALYSLLPFYLVAIILNFALAQRLKRGEGGQ